jgi:hypothetical protein
MNVRIATGKQKNQPRLPDEGQQFLASNEVLQKKRNPRQKESMGDTGLEPVTPACHATSLSRIKYRKRLNFRDCTGTITIIKPS